MLENIDASSSKAAIRVVMQSCRNQFPDQKDVTEKSFSVFGPKTYDECVLKYLDGISERAAVRQITFACRALHPKNRMAGPGAKSKSDSYLAAAEASGAYILAARTLDQFAKSSCGYLAKNKRWNSASEVYSEVILAYPESEQPKIRKGIDSVWNSLPSPYKDWGGIQGYIDTVSGTYEPDVACGMVLGEVGALYKSSEANWKRASSEIR